MTLIGLAYNQKPEPTELTSPASEGGRQEDGELPRPDEEPPSRTSNLSIAELIARDEFAEWDSPATIAAVESALSRLGKVVRLEANEDFPERLRQARPDIVFNIAEGFHGVTREAQVPAICEFYGIPYSGSDPFTLTLCLDKARAKETLAFHGIPTPKFLLVEKLADLYRVAEKLTLVAMNFESLPEGALPIYSFDAKFVWDRPENPLDIFQCPARITRELQASIERVTLDAFRVLGCRDWARIDVRLDADGKPNVLEVNPLPGILPDPADNSCLPKAARAAGIGYEELIQNCLKYAAARQGVDLHRSLSRAGGAHDAPALAASGSA